MNEEAPCSSPPCMRLALKWRGETELLSSVLRATKCDTLSVEGLAFGKGVDPFVPMVEPFRAVAAFIPVLHFPSCLPDLWVEQDCCVDRHPDSGGSSWKRAPELICQRALVKANDAKVAVCRLPAAHERFCNALLDRRSWRVRLSVRGGEDAGRAESWTQGERIIGSAFGLPALWAREMGDGVTGQEKQTSTRGGGAAYVLQERTSGEFTGGFAPSLTGRGSPRPRGDSARPRPRHRDRHPVSHEWLR